jgi:BlaI family transcriptional regulator, penicillinase repressor
MTDRPGLSKGEMIVARLLWDKAPASVRQIHSSLPADQTMDFSTVQTYLRRLESKGYASSILDGKTRIYSATTKPTTVVRNTVDELVKRLFGGSSMPLMRHLIQEHSVTKDELSELRQMIERLESEQLENEGNAP